MKILDIAIKDLLHSLRSLFAVGMMLGMPLVLTGLLYAAFGGGGNASFNIPAVNVGVVNLDQAPPGQPGVGDMLYDMLSDPSVSAWLHPSRVEDEASARAAVSRQELGMALVIPADFSSRILGGQGSGDLRVIQDPALSTAPAVVRSMINLFLDGVVGARVALVTIFQRSEAAGIQLDESEVQFLSKNYRQWYTAFQRTLYHTDKGALVMRAVASTPENQAGFLQRLMGLILCGQMIFFAFYTGAYAMTSVLREDEEGTLARLFTTPTPRTSILAGKFLAVLFTVLVQGAVLMLAGRLVFGVDWGQPGSAALAFLGQAAAASGLGVLLISLIKSRRQEGVVLGGVLTVFGMLGGLFTVGVTGLPAALQSAALFTPHGWVLRLWKLAMGGSAPAELLPSLLATLALGAAMFAAGALIFRRRYA